jgi:hypothetical protein
MLKQLLSSTSSKKAAKSTETIPGSSTFVIEARRALAIAACAPVKGVRRQLV